MIQSILKCLLVIIGISILSLGQSYSQEKLFKKKDFKLVSTNDTILKVYYWNLYNNKEIGKVVLLISKDSINKLPKIFQLEKQSRIKDADVFLPVCCNELYIDNIIVIPKNSTVYKVKAIIK